MPLSLILSAVVALSLAGVVAAWAPVPACPRATRTTSRACARSWRALAAPERYAWHKVKHRPRHQRRRRPVVLVEPRTCARVLTLCVVHRSGGETVEFTLEMDGETPRPGRRQALAAHASTLVSLPE